jgi:CBS domain-containing protein
VQPRMDETRQTLIGSPDARRTTMRVADVMTHSAECARPSDSIAHAAERMRELDVGALPVCGDNDKLAGIVTDRDITIRGTAECCDPEGTHVSDIMTPGIVYCFEDQDVSEAARVMEEKQVRRLVVLNRDRRMVGILSLGDLAVRNHDDRLSGEALERISEPAMAAG